MASIFYRLCIVVLSFSGAFFGLQQLAFLETYETLLDGQIRQADEQLAPYIRLAQRDYRSDLPTLLEAYQADGDARQREQSQVLKTLYQDLQRWQQEKVALGRMSFIQRSAHILNEGFPGIARQAREQPQLTIDATFWILGLILMLICTLGGEIINLGLMRLIYYYKDRTP